MIFLQEGKVGGRHEVAMDIDPVGFGRRCGRRLCGRAALKKESSCGETRDSSNKFPPRWEAQISTVPTGRKDVVAMWVTCRFHISLLVDLPNTIRRNISKRTA
jgi:hypothetical protein